MRTFLLILLAIGVTAMCLTGCERPMAKPMMDAVTPTDMSTMEDPETFAVAFVQAAIDFYKMEGREAAIAYYNDTASVNGQWYVFIVDDTDFMVSHAVLPELVGTDIKDDVSSIDYPLGVEIAKATEEGHWIDYLAPNPQSNKLEQKRTWVIRYDGYIFGSGYYEPWHPDPATLLSSASKEDPEAFTRAVVLAAVARYESEGVETTATYYNDSTSVDEQWYVFITDEDDIFVAHAPRPDFVGTDLKDVIGPDGSPVGVNIAKATGSGLWIEYLWPNPETGMDEQKRTWAIRHDGYLFGSGYYEPAAGNATPETN